MKLVAAIIAIGFVLSFWWLGPLVVASFVAGGVFTYLYSNKIKVVIEELS